MGPESVNCPHCGARNPATAFFCGECGRQVRSLVSGEEGPVEEVGGEIELDSILDDDDGQAVDQSSGRQYPPPEVQPVEPVTPGPVIPPTPAPPPQPAGPPPLDFNAPRPPQPEPPPQLSGVPQRPADPPPLGFITPRPDPPQQPPYQQPPPGRQPYQPPQYQQPYQQQPPYQQYQGGYPPANAPGWDPGNTSGMGPDYPAPPEAAKQSCAGCIPFGVFAFANSAITWGIIGALQIIPYLGMIPALVYAIYIFTSGRRLAWQSRRFHSVQQFDETMNSWHNWGIGCLIANIISTVILVIIGAVTEGFEP